MATIYDFSLKTADGGSVPLADYRGKVLLIVNIATRCGFTPQTAELEALQQTFGDAGFSVLGVPSDEFGGQTPEDDAEVVCFLKDRYEVTFPVFAKVNVNGATAEPLFTFLKEARGGFFNKEIKWNFTKFLVGKDGTVISRHAPAARPKALEKAVRQALFGATQ